MVERDGQQLGNYRLVRRLGHGGVAEVYLGEHVFLNTQAAIKLLQAPLSEQDMPAFLREARTIAGLVHPNIVRVLDFGVQNETFYLVMEYAPRGTLRQNYPPGTRLSAASVVVLVKQIAAALQYAHDQNIIHCDVKPENVLLGKDNVVLLSDFGISMVLQTMSAQQVQHIAGTIAYMAPEQFDGKPQRASDQYALAVIAYEWLSGERPFQGNIASVGSQHLYAQVPPLSEKVSGIPLEVDEVLHTAMEKDPARRFGSIRAFARALEQAYGKTPIEAIPTISEVGPAWLATIAPDPTPTPIPGVLNAVYLPQDATLAGGHASLTAQSDTDADKTSDPYRVQPALGQLQPVPGISGKQFAGGATQGKNTSRRAFLVGAGGGAVVVGVVVALVTSGKIASLFALGTAKPHTSSTPTAKPTRPTPTPNVPIGTTLTTYTRQSSDVTGVCWLPTTSRMVASSSLDGSVAVWNAITGGTVLLYPQGGQVNALAWSPNGLYIASAGSASTVEVWNAMNGNKLATCTGHTLPIFGLAWSPDSQRLVSASQDHSAIVWNALSGSQLTSFTGHSDVVWVAAWSPDGNSIASGSFDKTVRIWDPNNGSLIRPYSSDGIVRSVDWSPNGSLIASGGDNSTVQIWQAANGSILTTYRGHSNHVEAAQWSRDGQRVASAGQDHTAQIWHATDASPIYTYTGHRDLIWSLAWSPDGQLIATGSADRTARVWQAV